MPVMRVVTFKVEGAADFGSQNFVVSQIRCIAQKFLKVVGSHFLLDLVPLFGTLVQ
jgi:hypothetical protein